MNILNHFTIKETIYSQNYQGRGVAGLKSIVRNFGNRVKCIQANDPQKGTFTSVNPDETLQNAASLHFLPQLTQLVIVADHI